MSSPAWITRCPPVGRPARARLRFRLLACLFLVGASLGSALALAPALAAAAARPSDIVGFSGPTRGLRGGVTPRAGDFNLSCNAYVNTDAGAVGGKPIPIGSALMATSGCGRASLLLDVPGPGNFQARFAIAADDTSGQPGVMNIHVIDRSGHDLQASQLTTTRGSVTNVDVDVNNAVAIVLGFSSTSKTFLYGFKLTGTARALQLAPGHGNALPPGARPFDLAGATRTCNAYVDTDPYTVSRVAVTTSGTDYLIGCGQLTLGVPAGTQGTLVLRYGAIDTYSFAGRMTVTVAVHSPDGSVLRKVTGVAWVGSGLLPMWIDLTGGSTVVIAADGGTDTRVVITAAGILPRTLPVYSIPNRTITGGPSGGTVPVDPNAFVSKCNSAVGSSDVIVGGKPVFAGTYLSTYSCGTASLVFCCTNAVGTFYARFGVPTTGTGGNQPSVTVIVKDKDDHVLRTLTARALYGAVGTLIAVDVRRASVLTFAFNGETGVLYNMRLRGSATISEFIYPPVSPPKDPRGGMPVNPNDFTLTCNAYLAKDDLRLVGATTLGGWALSGYGCGQANLNLGTKSYPRHYFYARVGIAIGEPPDSVVTVRFNVLDNAGKVVRYKDVTARYGYGTQPMRISLSGGAVLQIVWDQLHLANTGVYAMTAS